MEPGECRCEVLEPRFVREPSADYTDPDEWQTVGRCLVCGRVWVLSAEIVMRTGVMSEWADAAFGDKWPSGR